MPELPEVESLRCSLARLRLRAPVASIWRSDKALRTGAHWQREDLARLVGAIPGAVTRRGKYLLWRFERPSERLGLLVHLGMTGRLVVATPDEPVVTHTHVRIELRDGSQVRYVDPRRFGGLRAARWVDLRGEPPIRELGPEPFSSRFGGAHLDAVAGDSARPLRDVLLDQRIVAGVGNIYALEALFRAGLHPLVRARRLRDTAWDRLAQAIRTVLREAIGNGGTTFRDYVDALGNRGRNETALWVYGRAGEPCRSCGTVLVGFVLGGRSGVFCPHEQPRPRGRIG